MVIILTVLESPVVILTILESPVLDNSSQFWPSGTQQKAFGGFIN